MKEEVLKIDILGTLGDNFTTDTKKDVVVSLGKGWDEDEDEDDKISRGFHLQVLNENMFAKAMLEFHYIPSTCVSSMHSQKCVTILKVRRELKVFFFLLCIKR